MSKVTKRKITVESPSSKLVSSNTLSNNITNKDSQRRQSVFERLGTKTGASISINTTIAGQPGTPLENFCRHWNQNGTCPYGKSCVFVNTHTLISPSKRVPKKELDPKQVLARSLEEGLKLEGLKRLHSTVVKRGSPDLNWESWDQSDLEYEDEKVLEKRRQLLQRELELQMKREETEEHHSRRRHTNTKPKKGLSSSSSTSVSSTSSESSTSSDESSSDSSSTSGIAGDAKRRRNKGKKSKRGSISSVSDSERKKILERSKSMHKDRSPSNISRKSTSSKDKRAFTPPRKSSASIKMTARKKSPSPAHRRHNTPTASNKNKPSTSKSSTTGSRYNQSPRPSNKRSTSMERKDKHKRSLSPRSRTKPTAKERSPRSRPRRKDSPDVKGRNSSRSRLPDSRIDDRKKEDDRSRNKDDRRPDRKSGTDRDKRDHEDARTREKAREAAREKEREEALERCRERQREREQLAKEKERTRERERPRDEKDATKPRDYDKTIPPIMTLSTHSQPDRKIADRERDRPNKDRKDREKDRDKDKDRDRDRLYDRNLEKPERNRPLEKERLLEKVPERDRPSEKERPRERDNLVTRSREKVDRDRSFERDRNFDRSTGEPTERPFDREKDRASKVLDRSRDRDFDRDKDRNYDRVTDNRRSFEKAGERERTSLEKDRGVVRDRGLDRVLELRERNKSLDRGRVSDSERSVDRSRDRFDREGRFDRRALPTDDKGYESPYDSRRDRTRYGADGTDRAGLFKDLSPSREDARSLRHSQGFNEDRREDRRGRGGRDVRGGWEVRGGYDDTGPAKARDWDYPDSRRDWEARNRHGDWEGGVEGEDWGRYSGGAEWGASDWREEWPHRPPRHAPRDDQTIVSSNHIVVRDANVDDSGGRRSQVLDSTEKDAGTSGEFKKESGDAGTTSLETGSHKRARDESDVPVEAKKPRLEEPPPSAILEEALSDISDDPDEILNREDIDVTPQDSAVTEEDVRLSALSAQPSAQELDQRLLEPGEEENIDNLDFEEISDEELEEEARANKGLGDALGVDWASLVSESRPRAAEAQPGAARRRWQPQNILARIGVSLQYAGEQVFEQIQQKLSEKQENDEEDQNKTGLLHPVAYLHVALRERQARRRCLFSGTDTFKRALSARADIAIRRQLCNLPVTSLETQQSSGFCQWVV